MPEIIITGFDKLNPPPSPRHTAPQTRYFKGAEMSRLTMDWVTASLSVDQELRRDLRRLRQRSRDLAWNDDYAARFFGLLRTNVTGPHGIKIDSRLEDIPNADSVNTAIETSFKIWERPANCAVNGKMSWTDIQHLFITGLAMDGEIFIRKHRGFSQSAHGFALEFIDPDLIDLQYNRKRIKPGENEIRLGIEMDQFYRPVAYHMMKWYPADLTYGAVSEPAGTGNPNYYIRIPADEMIHAFIPLRCNQTRGVPFLHAAITRLRHMGEYEEAELIASRLEACKMGFFTSKTGDEYPGTKDERGRVVVEAGPGNFEELPEGIDFKSYDPQHPTKNFSDFIKATLRGVGAGVGVSYNNLANDLREVNFSSIRSGLLEERDTYRMLQRFTVERFLAPVYTEWLASALLFDQIRGVKGVPQDYDRPKFQPRGWAWVDPLKDANAHVIGLGAGFETLSSVCAQQGLDWREVLIQRKKEQDEIKKLGVELDITVKAAPNATVNEDLGNTPAQEEK